MEYVKSYEMFEGDQMLNEETSLKNDMEKKYKSLSGDEKETLKAELIGFAEKMGLKPEELGDIGKVTDALAKKKEVIGILKENEDSGDEESLLEGMFDQFKSWYQKKRDKLLMWLVKFGGLTMLGGMITAGIGAEMDAAQEAALRMGQTLDPNSTTVVGGIVVAIGLAAVMVGLVKGNALSGAASAAAGARK